MTGTGVVQDVTGIALSTALTTQSMPAVTSGGTGYLVAWTDYRNNATASADIYGTRVSDAGLVQDPSGSALSTAPNRQITPSVASNGDDYLVAWSDYRNNATTKYDIYGTRVTAAGAVQDVNGLALSTASSRPGQVGSTHQRSPPMGPPIWWAGPRNATRPRASTSTGRV